MDQPPRSKGKQSGEGFILESLSGGVIRLSVTRRRSSLLQLALLVPLAANFVILFLAFSEALPLYLAIGICTFLLFIVASTARPVSSSVSESISIFPGLGVQLEGINGQRLFFSAADIELFTINEGFERCKIVVYLVLVTISKRCVVLFDETRPDLKALIASFEALDTWLAEAKSASK